MTIIKVAPLPGKVRGTVVRRGGDDIIIVNEALCPKERERAVRHEAAHIIRGHIDAGGAADAWECEVSLRREGF